MRFLHTADIHIGKRLKAYGDEIEAKLSRALLATLSNIMALAEREKVDLLLIAGDFIEQKEISQREEREVISILSAARDFEILIVAGNHDPFTVGGFYSKLDKIPRLHVFSPERTECLEFPNLDTAVYGRSYGVFYQREPFDLPLCDSKMSNRLAVIHGDLTRPAETSDYCGFSTEAVRESDLHYLALGHIHKPSERNAGGQYDCIGRTTVVYPGCPQGLSFSEAGERHVLVGELHHGRWKKLEPVPAGEFCFFDEEVAVDGVTTETEIVNAIGKQLLERHGPDFGRHIYRLTLTGEQDSPLPLAEIKAQLRQSNDFEVPPVHLTDKTYISCDPEELARESGLIGEFVREYYRRAAEKNADREALDRALNLAVKSFSRRRTS